MLISIREEQNNNPNNLKSAKDLNKKLHKRGKDQKNRNVIRYQVFLFVTLTRCFCVYSCI